MQQSGQFTVHIIGSLPLSVITFSIDQANFHFFHNLQSSENCDESSEKWLFSFDKLPSTFFCVRSCSTRVSGTLRMALGVLFRKQDLMAILKSGFRKAYISGFTNEPVATVNKETIDRASGMTSILFIVLAVVM